MAYEKIKLFVLAISVTVFFLLAYFNQAVLGVMLLALILWSLFPKRFIISSVIIVLILMIFQSSVSIENLISSILSTYGTSNLFIIIAGFILAAAMDVTGLAKRVALKAILLFGEKPRYILLSIALVNLLIAPLSPSTTTKAFIMLPICIGFIQALNVKKGSVCAAVIMLMCVTANNISSTAFLTATVPNPISASYMADAGLKLTWSSWFLMAFPLTVILLITSLILIEIMFKPNFKFNKKTLKNINGINKKFGPMKREEKVVATLFIISLLLWITERHNPLNAGLISLILSLLLFLPRIGVFKIRKFGDKLPWDSLFIFAAAMYFARVVEQTKALTPVIKQLIGNTGKNLPTSLLLFFVVSFSVFIHLIFTSTTVYATVIMPIVIAIASVYGIPISLLALPVAFVAPLALILPVNTIPNIIFYSQGYFSTKQMIMYGIVLSIISIVLVMLIGIPYWRFIGLIK